MVEICGWMFVLLNTLILGFVFRNLVLGIQNVNKEPVRLSSTHLPTHPPTHSPSY